MVLVTKERRRKLPPLGATENDPDPLVIRTFFYPDFHRWFTPCRLSGLPRR